MTKQRKKGKCEIRKALINLASEAIQAIQESVPTFLTVLALLVLGALYLIRAQMEPQIAFFTYVGMVVVLALLGLVAQFNDIRRERDRLKFERNLLTEQLRNTRDELKRAKRRSSRR